MLVEAAPLVPDKTICNPINDFKRGGVALIDARLSFVVSGMLNPNAAKYSERGFRLRSDSFRGKEKGTFINSTAMSPENNFN